MSSPGDFESPGRSGTKSRVPARSQGSPSSAHRGRGSRGLAWPVSPESCLKAHTRLADRVGTLRWLEHPPRLLAPHKVPTHSPAVPLHKAHLLPDDWGGRGRKASSRWQAAFSKRSPIRFCRPRLKEPTCPCPTRTACLCNAREPHTLFPPGTKASPSPDSPRLPFQSMQTRAWTAARVPLAQEAEWRASPRTAGRPAPAQSATGAQPSVPRLPTRAASVWGRTERAGPSIPASADLDLGRMATGCREGACGPGCGAVLLPRSQGQKGQEGTGTTARSRLMGCLSCRLLQWLTCGPLLGCGPSSEA